MRHALNLPLVNEYSNPQLLNELAQEAETAGWDGVFVCDVLPYDAAHLPPVIDPWIALTAIAMRTQRVTIGPLVTALARRRPWKVAREVVALDHLSGGRLVLGVGLCHDRSGGLAQPGDQRKPSVHARKLDEALDIVAGLCSGQPFRYTGRHFKIQETLFLPRPVQERIPIWVAGQWPNKAQMRRAARWDGAYPAQIKASGSKRQLIQIAPETVEAILAFIKEQRAKATPFDMVISRSLWHDEPSTAQEMVAAFADAGATWIVQDVLPWEVSPKQARELIHQGPPGKQ